MISEKDKNNKHLETELSSMKDYINSFNDRFINKFITKQKRFKSDTIKKLKEVNINKFNNLKRRTFQQLNFNTIVKSDWLMNLSSINVPNDISWLLSLGKKYSLPIEQKSFPMFNFIADIESILNCEPDEEVREQKRSKLANILHKEKFCNSVKSPIDAEIIRIYNSAKRFLAGKNVVITTADKGSRTVIIDKSDYEAKMSKLLSDQNT